jgi:hypothetical protein
MPFARDRRREIADAEGVTAAPRALLAQKRHPLPE